MPQFISKLQHDSYERGEFTDEKVRDLSDTLDLIKNFPWDTERGHTDIQLTGPSVTIQDNQGSYLKIALYFGGKFCLYYLDHHNHLYEYHASDLDEINAKVTDYFRGNLALKDFDRHLFNIGNKVHFVNGSFNYRIKFATILIYSIPMMAFLLFFAFIFISGINFNPTGISLSSAIGLISICILIVLAIIAGTAMSDVGMVLNISKGNDVFQFGKSSKNVQQYSKVDVSHILCPRGRRQGIDLSLFKTNIVVFKNGDSIILPSLLIDKFALCKKFSDSMGNIKIPVIVKRKSTFRVFDSEINEGAAK